MPYGKVGAKASHNRFHPLHPYPSPGPRSNGAGALLNDSDDENDRNNVDKTASKNDGTNNIDLH
jgi:hypothetical protein